MPVFANWQQFAVRQKRPQTGCIPWSFEILLRAGGVKGIDFETFQDDFDFDKDLPLDTLEKNENRKNCFESVATAIEKRYPSLKIVRRAFGDDEEDAKEKISFLESRAAHGLPVIVSLKRFPEGCHVMPMVDIYDSYFMFLHRVDYFGVIFTCHVEKAIMEKLHYEYHPDGSDIAYLAD